MFNRPIPSPAAAAAASTNKGGKQGGKKKKKQPGEAMHIVRDSKRVQDLQVQVRGDPSNKGPKVPRRFLSVLSVKEAKPFQNGSGRLELARAIASPTNPLTARVIVNRIWARYFGRGIVDTPSNFGVLGSKPSHPKLLDDLSVRFMENGWSLKWLHREIVFSETYQQSSTAKKSKAVELDPDNRLLWRMSRRRLDVESFRDAVLAASGRLDRRVGGPSISPRDPKARRRTLYSRISRFELDRLLVLFDFPDPNTHAAKRVETTTPLQKLFVLNSQFMDEISRAVAGRIQKNADTNDGGVAQLYRLLFARAPSAAESKLGASYVAAMSKAKGPEAAWSSYAQALFATSEMLYID
ncbi:MAG: DUF1553 domain-containing protein [Planctomycetota bacterium]